jgi:hypothetical protein
MMLNINLDYDSINGEPVKVLITKRQSPLIGKKPILREDHNLVPRAFPFLSLGRREKALAPGGLLCILIGQ